MAQKCGLRKIYTIDDDNVLLSDEYILQSLANKPRQASHCCP